MQPGDTVHFTPWQGQHYSTTGLDGLRLLVVGESHYRSAPEQVDNESLTNRVMDEYVNDKYRGLVFQRIQELVTGTKPAGVGSRSMFWDAVAFYNFVPRLLASLKPNDRPTTEDWKAGRLPFLEVLRSLTPDAVLVVSTSSWRRGMSSGYIQSVPVANRPGMFQWSVLETCSPLAIRVNHPTGTRGFKVSTWRPRVEALFEETRRRGLPYKRG